MTDISAIQRARRSLPASRTPACRGKLLSVGILAMVLASCASEEHSSKGSQGLTETGGVAGQSTGAGGGNAGRGNASDGGSAGGQQSASCTGDQKIFYEDLGCGSHANPLCEKRNLCLEFCEAPNQPPGEVGLVACACDGTTVQADCCIFDKPIRYWGPCTDGGITDSGTG